MAELARVLPFWAISRKLGLPRGDEERMRQLALAMFGQGFSDIDSRAAVQEITATIQPVLDAVAPFTWRRRALTAHTGRARTGRSFRTRRSSATSGCYSPWGPRRRRIRWPACCGRSSRSPAYLRRPGSIPSSGRTSSTNCCVVSPRCRCCRAGAPVRRRPLRDGAPRRRAIFAAIAAANREPERFPEPDPFVPCPRAHGDPLVWIRREVLPG